MKVHVPPFSTSPSTYPPSTIRSLELSNAASTMTAVALSAAGGALVSTGGVGASEVLVAGADSVGVALGLGLGVSLGVGEELEAGGLVVGSLTSVPVHEVSVTAINAASPIAAASRVFTCPG